MEEPRPRYGSREDQDDDPAGTRHGRQQGHHRIPAEQHDNKDIVPEWRLLDKYGAYDGIGFRRSAQDGQRRFESLPRRAHELRQVECLQVDRRNVHMGPPRHRQHQRQRFEHQHHLQARHDRPAGRKLHR